MFVLSTASGYVFSGASESHKVDLTLSWCSDEPLSILMSADDGVQGPVVWRFARHLLAEALGRGRRPGWVGEGDVAMRAPGAYLTLHLRPPEQHSVQMVVRREPFDQLIRDAEKAVPDGGDFESELVAAAIDRELAKRPA